MEKEVNNMVDLAVVKKDTVGDDVDVVTEAELNKLRRKLPTGMAEEIEAMGVEELEDRIKQSSVNESNVRRELKANPYIKAHKEALKEARQPFTDAIRTQRAIAEYAFLQLKLKGKA